MLTKIKHRVQELISIEAKLIYNAGLKPNMVSALGAAFGLLSGAAYWAAGSLSNDSGAYKIYVVLAALLLSLSGFCDTLDGALARLYGKTTILGGFLDSLLDRYVDAAVLCGLIIGGICDPFWGLLALIGSLLTSYVRARSEAAGIPMESIGVMERAERILVIIIASIIDIIWVEIPALKISVIFLAVASNLTVIQRALYFYKRTRQKSGNTK
jgi:archaetidylinositol phosphate synthase